MTHHYSVNEQGNLQWVNLIIATGHDNLAINRGVGQVSYHSPESRWRFEQRETGNMRAVPGLHGLQSVVNR